MDAEKFWLLLSVKLSGEATPDELNALEQMLKQHPELCWQAQLITQMWKPERECEAPNDFFDKHLQRLSNHPDTQSFDSTKKISFEEVKKKSGRYRWLLAFSSIAAAVAIIFFFLYKNKLFVNISTKTIAQNTVTTHKGSKSSIQLPDGTMVWLNADSKLTYDENFRGDYRKVYLQGEAYFDVVKDEHRPFIIYTNTLDIRVLGTVFNVKAYEAESNTETSLIKGLVEVTLHNSPEKKIILKPNEKLSVNNQNAEYSAEINEEKKKSGNKTGDMNIVVGKIHYQKKDSMAIEALWVRNKLAFDAETLEEVMRKIERWYNVSVVINVDEKIKSTEYTAIFENENLIQVMEALKITGSFLYTINKNVVTIK
jgi:ferric-dicitrate binding protein FerR (iron transport regulator)